jgi:uncharacterized repeat protein (TIGR01451 family)
MRTPRVGVPRLLRFTLAVLIGLLGSASSVDAQLALYQRWDGPIGYVATGASFRDRSNLQDPCSLANDASAALAGIPAGSTIVSAFLYWIGSGEDGDWRVRLNGSNVDAPAGARWTGTYQNGNQTLEWFGARVDVTNRISGNGTITVENLSVDDGDPYCSSEAVIAGWSLMVVYQNNTLPLRRVNLWNGFDVLRSGSRTVTIGDFMAAPSPDGQLSISMWDGDATLTSGEILNFNGVSLDNSGDVFRSRTGNGFDLLSYNVGSNVTPGSRTSTIDYATGLDLIISQFLASSVSIVTVDVTPKGVPALTQRLPGTGYSAPFVVENTSLASDDFDLLISRTGSPVGMQIDSITGAGLPGNKITGDSARVNFGALASRTFTVWYTVPAGAPVTNRINFRARSVTYPTRPEATSLGFLDIARLQPIPDLSVSKTASALQQFGSGTYTITAINSATAATLSALTVVDTLPAGVTYVSAAGAGWTFAEAAGVVTATYAGTLAASASAPFTVSVAVANAAASITNRAHISGGGDVTPGNNSASVTTAVTQRPDLTVTKTSQTFTVGQTNRTYSIVVRNDGGGASSGTITVTDTLPVGLTYQSAAGTGWTVSWNGTARVLTATRTGALAASTNAPTLTVTVTVEAAAFPSVTNRAWVSGGNDAVTTNNSGEVTTAVTAPDVSLTKTASALQQFATGTYTITATNSATAATIGALTVVDTLPAGMTYVSAVGTGWTFAEAAGVVTATYAGSLAVSTSAPFTITVAVANAAASITNRAHISGGGDATPGNNSASVTTAVTQRPDLTVTKTSQTFTVGQTNRTYSIVVRNDGGGASSGTITVTDTLPVGLTYQSASGTGWTVSWNGAARVLTATRTGALAASTNAPTLTVTVTVEAAAFPSVTNRAWVAGGNDAVTTNNSGEVTTAVSAADVSLTKTASALQQFATGTYTITATNSATAATIGALTVVDTLPAGMTYVSAAGTGWTFAEAAGVVTATYAGSLAVSASAPFTITVAVANAAASITNRAHISGGGDVTPGNNSASVTTAVTQRPDLTVTKTSQTFTVGQTNRTYSIVVRNDGGGASSGTITVTDTLPVGLTYQSASGTGWTVSWNGTARVLTATRTGALAASTNAPTLTVTVTIAAAAFPSVTNRAWVSGGNDAVTTNNSGEVTTAVSAADVSLTKTASALQQFATGTYTITATNSATAATLGALTVVDTLPAGMTYVSAAGTGWTFAEAAGVVTATYAGSLAVSSSAPFTITVAVANAAASITNRAHISGGGDVTPGNNSASVTTAVTQRPDLTVTKTSQTFTVGQTNRTYSIVVRNDGGGASSGTITVTDTLPVGLTYQSAAGTGWTVSWNGTSRVLTATRTGALAASTNAPTLTVTVTVEAAAFPSVTNRAWVSGGNDAVTTNNSGEVTTAVTAPDISLTKTASALQQFATGTYTITATNSATAATAGALTVVDTLPAGMTYVSAAGTGWTFAHAAGVVTATYAGTLAVSTSAPFTITVDVANAAASITNRAHISGGGDATLGNNSASVTTAVTQRPDLTVTKTSQTFTVGQTNRTYSIVVRNDGGGASSGTITVTDTLPVGLAYQSASGTGWTVNWNGTARVLTATRTAALAASTNAPTLTVTVNVEAAAFPSVTNRAWVSGGNDAVTTNNSGEVTTAVTGADLTVAKTSSSFFTFGAQGSYTLTVSNVGNAASLGTITVRDTLPLGIGYVSHTGAGWTLVTGDTLVDGRVWGELTYASSIAVGASAPALVVTVVANAAAVGTVTNRAHVTGGGDVDAGNNSATVTTEVRAPDLTVSKQAIGSFTVGQTPSYEITALNSGNSVTTAAIVVVDTLPTGLTVITAMGAGWTVTTVGQVVTATRTSAMTAGTSASFTIQVLVTAGAGSSTTNRAWISGGGEVNTTNNGSGPVVSPVQGVPTMSISKSVLPSGAVVPGTDLTYEITIFNSGSAQADSVVVIENIPPETEFKLGSVLLALPPATTTVTEYFDGTTWGYVPVSGGCGAAPGYDRCVVRMRWSLSAPVAVGGSGEIRLVTRVR